MKILHTIAISLFIGLQLWACNSNSEVAYTNDNAIETITYDSFLKTLPFQKKNITTNDYNGAKNLLFTVVDSVIPHYWNGTGWDFNGTTKTPKKGDIACGYFLTTTMKQTGYDIDRVHMAQQASSVLIKSYCSEIKTVQSVTALRNYLKDQPDSSTFILGLDFHVGFVTKNKGELYFIHSNYINRQGVVKEKIEDSQALATNSFFMIGSMNANKARLSEWMNW